MYSKRMLFTDELFTAYQGFMASLFDMYASMDADARCAPRSARCWGIGATWPGGMTP